MSLRCTCPDCRSVFRLNPGQLASAAGWVQCGLCGCAFDAGASFIDDTPADATPVVVPAPLPLEVPAAPDTVPRAESVIAAGPVDDLTPPHEPPAPPHALIELAQPRPAGVADALIMTAPIEPAPVDVPLTAAPITAASETRVPPEDAAAATMPAAASSRWGFSAVLALLLIAQLLWFLRDRLVDVWPATRPAVLAVCEWAGCAVGLPRQLANLDIIGSELVIGHAPGVYTLALTLGNRATDALAWPLIVVTLTDTDARPLARRSFAPSEYWQGPQARPAGVPPREEVPVSLQLRTHTLIPEGYQVVLAY